MIAIRLIVDERRALRQHVRHAARSRPDIAIDVPPHLTVEVIGIAGFSVRCSCGAWLWMVQLAARRGCLAAVVDEHRRCE